MKNRIKQIRKNSENDSQEKFAKSLGLSRSFIAQVETGKNKFSERTIKDICRIYNVNEEWLKNGTGEMYKPRSENEIIAKVVNDLLEAKSEDIWKVLEKIAKKMY